jgi:diguanylate cyclase (GGDEF)-like protein
MTELFVNQTALLWENFSMLESLRREAKEDFLTGVANRNEMEKILDYLFSIEKPDLRFFLLLIDIDDFKGINDRHGHAWGDRILVEHSRILKSLLRGNDFVARYGGDEFLVVIRDLDLPKVREIAERLREEIKGQLQTTVSIGVACYPRDSRSRIGLFEMADRGLYRAKQNGRNCVVFYGDP